MGEDAELEVLAHNQLPQRHDGPDLDLTGLHAAPLLDAEHIERVQQTVERKYHNN